MGGGLAVKMDGADMGESGGGGCSPCGAAILKAEGRTSDGLGGLHGFRRG